MMTHCATCKGSVHAGVVNHIVELDGKIIIIKNVPALVCSQCGEGFVETVHAYKLEELVNSARLQGMEIVIMNYASIAA